MCGDAGALAVLLLALALFSMFILSFPLLWLSVAICSLDGLKILPFYDVKCKMFFGLHKFSL